MKTAAYVTARTRTNMVTDATREDDRFRIPPQSEAIFGETSCPNPLNSSFVLSYRPSGSDPHELILFSFEKSLFNGETTGHTRQLSAGKQRRKNYDSLNLVHYCWVDRGGYREISDARAHDDFLDNRARHHRIDHRRRGYPYVFAADNRTISSRRPHFFHTWRDPGSLRLYQAEYPFSPRSLIQREENCSRGRAAASRCRGGRACRAVAFLRRLVGRELRNTQPLACHAIAFSDGHRAETPRRRTLR